MLAVWRQTLTTRTRVDTSTTRSVGAKFHGLRAGRRTEYILAMRAIVEGGRAMSNEKGATWYFHIAVRQLSATATSLKIKVGSVREIGDPRGEERSRGEHGNPEDRGCGGWTTLRFVLRRLDERERLVTSPFARTFLSVLFYIFYRSLSSHARSPDFPLTFLALSSLLYCRFFLCLSFCSLSLFTSFSFSSLRILFLHPSSHLSRSSPLLSAPCWVTLSFSLFSFSLLSSACLPSSSRTGRSCRARGWLASSWPTG